MFERLQLVWLFEVKGSSLFVYASPAESQRLFDRGEGVTASDRPEPGFKPEPKLRNEFGFRLNFGPKLKV